MDTKNEMAIVAETFSAAIALPVTGDSEFETFDRTRCGGGMAAMVDD